MDRRSALVPVALKMAQLSAVGGAVGAVISGPGAVWVGVALGAALAAVQGAEAIVRRSAASGWR